MVLRSSTHQLDRSGCSTKQLTFDHERKIDQLAAGIRELHPKCEYGGVCREAYRLCCEQLRSLSYPTYLAVMRDLKDQ